MAAALVLIAEAVRGDLARAALSQPVSVERVFLPQRAVEELRQAVVTVVPTGERIVAVARHLQTVDTLIDVALQRRLVECSNQEIDPLVALASELSVYFAPGPTQPGGLALTGRSERWVGTEWKLPFSPQHLDQHRVFTAVFQYTFRGQRG